jgi:hypothetical protein
MPAIPASVYGVVLRSSFGVWRREKMFITASWLRVNVPGRDGNRRVARDPRQCPGITARSPEAS